MGNKNYTIYMITCKTNNKAYIGQTQRTVEERWNAHLSCARNGSKFRFHSAIRKYGVHDWDITIISECDSLDEAWELEGKAIEEHKTFPHGYNANLGSTGGWIVGRLSPERQEQWKKLLSFAGMGSKNPNYCGTTDDELIKLAESFYNDFGFLAGRTKLIKYGDTKGVHFPKSFTKFRFGGSMLNFQKEVEKVTGAVFNPYHRDNTHKKKLSNATSNTCWVHDGKITKKIKLTNLKEYTEMGFIRGRLNGNKNKKT